MIDAYLSLIIVVKRATCVRACYIKARSTANWKTPSMRLSTCHVYASRTAVMVILAAVTAHCLPVRKEIWGSVCGERIDHNAIKI